MHNYFVPVFILSILLVSIINKHNDTYNSFISGCEEGIKSTLKIFPYVISMIFATSIFLHSNIIQDLFKGVSFINPKLVIQTIFRPISSSAALTVLKSIIEEHGVDSKLAIVSSILQGSTDTTIYVASIYFGAIGIKYYRYTLIIGLFVDFMCLVSAIIIASIFI